MAPVVINKFTRLSDKRFHRNIQRGIELVKNGMSFRAAAVEAEVASSSLHYHFHKSNNELPTRANSRLSLTRTEEDQIIQVLLKHGKQGRALCRSDLQDCVKMLVSTFPPHRRATIRFKNGRPGIRFCELFEARHAHQIILKRPSRQDAKRFAATNAKVLVHHMTTIKKLITHYNIPPSLIVNVDETGFSSVQDKCKGNLRRRYFPRGEKPFTTTADFRNVNHITLLGCAFADGRVGVPMFIFRGTRIRTRRISRSTSSGSSSVTEQVISEILPSNAVVTARKDKASVDSSNFFQWAEHFLEDTKNLRKGNQPMLLIYDAHRSHLSIPVLELLARSNVIGYALPAHTSGTTQPLDVAVFPPMKHHYRNMLDVVYRSRRRLREPIDEFDVAQIIRKSYDKSFNVSNIQAGFAMTGISPFDDCRLFAQARPYSYEEPNRIATLQEMCDMMDSLEDKSVEEIVENVHMHSSGFLDTAYGAVLTTEAALSLMKLSAESRNLKRQAGALAAAEKAKAEEIEKERRHVLRKHHDRLEALRRSRVYKEPFVMPRSLRLRRAIAKSRVAAKRRVAAFVGVAGQQRS